MVYLPEIIYILTHLCKYLSNLRMFYRFRYFTHVLALCSLVVLSSACHKRVGPTTLYILDPERHYLPLVQGEELRMNYMIYNKGRDPFIIEDIQPATLSIEFAKEPPRLIPPGDSAKISMIYHTDRNIGYVEHKIRIFGNVSQYNDSSVQGEVDLTFDTHIVRPSLDQSDYEERYWEKKSKNEKLVDGERGEQGYYTDEDIRENQLNDNYEFYPNHNRDKQVQRTVQRLIP